MGVYSVAIGILMVGFWGMLLATGQVPELQEAPREIAFHLAAEFATAILLVVVGAALLLGTQRARILSPLALGMLLYTVVNSAGFYAQRDNLGMVTMFMALVVLTVMAIALLLLK